MLAALLGVFAVSVPASAAPIAWGNATTLAGDSDVFTTGSSVFAYNWTTTQTVNGQEFTGTSSTTPLGLTFTSMSFTNATAFTSTAAPFADLSTAYKSILVGAIFSNGAVDVGAELSSLTAGRSYAVQVWASDPRGANSLRSQTLGGSGGNSVSLAYPYTTAGALGQYSVGVFAADATTQSFTLTPNTGLTPPLVNAIQLRDVTNLGAWTGINGATWDASTTANFASNLYSAPLVNTTADVAQAALGSVVFGDAYWSSDASTAVTQTAVTIAAGGVSADTVRFANSSLNYTLTSSDSTGLTGTSKLMKGGSGTLTLAGTNTYSGGTFIGGGVLAVAAPESLPGWDQAGGFSVTSGGGLAVGAGMSDADVSTLLGTGNFASGAAIGFDTSAGNREYTPVLADTVAGPLGLAKVGSGTLTLSANNTYSGGTTVSDGTLDARVASTTDTALGSGALAIDAGATAILRNESTTNITIANTVTGSGTLDIVFNSGGGQRNTSLNGVAGFDGTIRLSTSAASASADKWRFRATTPAALVINDGTTLFNEGGANFLGGITVSGAGNSDDRGAIRTNGTLGGDITLADDAMFGAESAATLTGAIASGAAGEQTLTFAGLATGNATLTGVIGGGPGTINLVQNRSTGTLTLAAANTFSGTMTVSAGTARLTNALALQNATLATGGVVFDQSVSGNAFTLGGLSGSGDIVLENNAVSPAAIALSIGNNGQATSHSGAISGAGSLEKVGAGALTLSATSTYTGSTTVSAGTLLVDGELSSTASLSVSDGARLGGSGRIATTIAGAGLVSPGNSPGITTANAVDPTGGLDFAFEFTTPGSPDYGTAAASNNDVLRLTDATPFTASLSGGNVIDVYFGVATFDAGDTFRGGFYTDTGSDFLGSIENATFAYWVLGNGSGTDTTFNGQGYYSLASFGPGLSVTLSTVAEAADFGGGTINGQVTQFVAVPEPGTLALAGVGIALAIHRFNRGARRKRARSASSPTS